MRLSWFLLTLTLAATAHAERPRDGTVVARMALLAPQERRFLLHGTVPLPSDVGPLEHQLRIRNHDAAHTLVEVQIDVVSRAATGEPDVIEISAPVELDPDEKRGQPSSFELVVQAPDPALPAQPRFETGKLAAALLGSNRTPSPGEPSRFGLRTRDVFGNTYWADLGNAVPNGAPTSFDMRSKDALWRHRERRNSVLAPIGTPSGTPLPHLMGVHAYLEARRNDDLVRLDLRIHNGLTSGSRPGNALDAPIGAIYWTSLELVLPKGWAVAPDVRDPFFGEGYDEGETRVLPIVKPLEGGKLHLMGPQAQFERRLVLVPSGDKKRAKAELNRENLAFCQRGENFWSWFDPRTARYFASRDILASLDLAKYGEMTGKAALRAKHEHEAGDLVAALESGGVRGWYVTSGVMGWAHPWFVKEAGGVGGEGICMLEGHDVAYAASRAGYRYFELLHRMNVSRQPEAMYDHAGNVVGHAAWLDKEGRIPFDFRTNGGVVAPVFRLPCKWGASANTHVMEVVKRDLRPPYDYGNWFEANGRVEDWPQNLLAWWPHDDEHLVRYTKNTKALVWLGNDWLAKDDLLLSAELYHLMRHESPHIPADWSNGVTLRVLEGLVKERPHQGAWVGRTDGWGVDAMCAAYSVASDDWRALNRPWFDRMSKLFLDSALENGLVQRVINERWLGDTRYMVTQTFEAFFLMHAMRCMEESVYRGVDDPRRKELAELARRGIEYLLWGPPWSKLPADWQPDPAHPSRFMAGPRWAFAISNNDNYATPPFCDRAKWGLNYLPADGLGGGVEIFQVWHALAYTADATQESHGKGLENRYLKRAIECGDGAATFAGLLEALYKQMNDPSMDNSDQWAGLAGRLQALGIR